MRALVAAALVACGPAAAPAPTGPPLHLSLPSADGGVIDFSALRGESTVVHLFATWSPPATGDAEHLRRLQEAGLAVVGVALDDPHVPGALAAWRRATQVPYPIAIASPAVRAGRSALGPVRQIPMTLLYDSRGRLTRRFDRALDAAAVAEIRSAAGL